LQTFPLITGAITILVTIILYKVFKAKQLHRDDEEDEAQEEEQQQQQQKQQSAKYVKFTIANTSFIQKQCTPAMNL
jgi:L-lactate permease